MSLAPRILYVDDDIEGCRFISYWLAKDFGCQVISAADGNHAKRLIEQEYFDLFLLDYCLPDTTATSLCGHIKSANPNAPIIVYSALDRDIDRCYALDAGANFYFVKPEQMDLVGSQIKQILGSSKKGSASRSGEFPSFTDRGPRPGHLRKKSAGIV